MQPFVSEDQMVHAHELMFGAAGRTCAELVLRWAPILFAVPLNPLAIRVVLAPVEIGPYNKHRGYHHGDGTQALILANRHHVGPDLTILDHQEMEDFIVHELTHARQQQLLKQNGWRVNVSRGAHRDLGWYAAVAEACPAYLQFVLPRSSWPTGPRTRAGTLSESDLTHWPRTIRNLAATGDSRLCACGGSRGLQHQFMCSGEATTDEINPLEIPGFLKREQLSVTEP
jgi:hypothetical protein